MYLIEGDGKAVLYTGDIRAETWWVNSLVQNPVLLPYTLGNRRLDCMYLDTTFATKREPYRNFPSKAEGIQELLDKVSQYPNDTIFYFHSWTFGYENVWIALSSFLGSQIHLDDYRARIYGSLSTLDKKQLRKSGLNVPSDNKSLRESGLEVREAPALCGFRNGNHIQPGCLTSRECARIHSCEQGMGCEIIDGDAQAKVVHIIPIVTRTNGIEIAELGAGGGKGDLDQKEDLETRSTAEIGKLIEVRTETIDDELLLSNVLAPLQRTFARSDGKHEFNMQLQETSIHSQDDFPLQMLVSALLPKASRSVLTKELRNRIIRFPYSRHSSYSELCELVAAFRPQDIFPCTVDEANWSPELSTQNLFGEYCSASTFRHDAEMTDLYEARMLPRNDKRKLGESQNAQSTNEEVSASVAPRNRSRECAEDSSDKAEFANAAESLGSTTEQAIGDKASTPHASRVSSTSESDSEPLRHGSVRHVGGVVGDKPAHPQKSVVPSTMQTSALPPALAMSATPATATSVQPPSSASSAVRRKKKLTNRQLAYEAAIGTHLTWADYGGLTSTRKREECDEMEL
jgi:hypothetical protein